MSILYFDYETYSEFDITKGGAYPYAEHPSTEVLLLGYAIDDGPVKVWDVTEGQECPEDLHQVMFDNVDTVFVAANANFERQITKNKFENVHMFADNTICTHVYAYQFAFTGGLGAIVEQAGVKHRKDPDGMRLINLFCKPAPGNHIADRYTKEEKPEDWAKFKQYCTDDVAATRSLYKYLLTLDDFQQEDYVLDQKINDKGLLVDVPMAQNIVDNLPKVKATLKQEVADMARSRGEELENAASHPQFQKWMRANFPKAKGTDKNAVQFTLAEEEVDDAQRFILESRMQLTSTAAAKFKRILGMQVDGLVRGILQMNGASRTGRWAGRGVQMQNIPGPYTSNVDSIAETWKLGPEAWQLLFGHETLKLAGKAVRPAFIAGEGNKFAIRDFSSIESRVAVALCNDTYGKRLTDQGICAYKAFAAKQLSTSVDVITKAQRTNAKPAVLGCTYMLGVKGYVRYVENQWDKRISLAQAESDVKTWRSLYTDIVGAWPVLNSAYKKCAMSKPGTVIDISDTIPTFAVQLERKVGWVVAWLPSGRGVWYKDPDVRVVTIGVGKDAFKVKGFTYMGKHPKTHKWHRTNTHGGGMLENLVQAISNDLLREWMRALDDAGLDIRLHVHDEAVVSCESDHDRVYELMGDLVPGKNDPGHYAADWSLDSDGYIVNRFTKQ